MKKTLLSLISITAFAANSFAQVCTPDANATGLLYPMIPDTTTNRWQDYTQTLTLSVPTDTNYQGLLTVYIDSVSLLSVDGLPNGLTYGCNSSLGNGNCTYPGGSEGCFIISGNVNDSAGVYPITLNIMGYGVLDSTGTDTTHLAVELPVDGYTLYVGEALSIQMLDNSKFDVIQNIPNPFNGTTTIKFNNPVAETVNFYVYDMIGRQVHNSKINAVTGVNTINYTSEKLAPGAYFYTIANGKSSITKRMIVTSK